MILVFGLGYVGLSNALVLSQNHRVVGIDIDENKIKKLNSKSSIFNDTILNKFLRKEDLTFEFTSDVHDLLTSQVELIIVALPTNYDEIEETFNTRKIEDLIEWIASSEIAAPIVLKSTLPIGFTAQMSRRHPNASLVVSPEFLREGTALSDCLNPNRIVVGGDQLVAREVGEIFANATSNKNVSIVAMGHSEAEATKLFANTYLAMRVAFFNELDSFALTEDLSSAKIIHAASLDQRIGSYYNNPSFGYGGYCLPKDTKQLSQELSNIESPLIKSIDLSNTARIDFMMEKIIEKNPKCIGMYHLGMKAGSDNQRESVSVKLLQRLKMQQAKIYIYDPNLTHKDYEGCEVISNLKEFGHNCDIIVANRCTGELSPFMHKVFSRDLIGTS